jgi:peroxiredoxin family protein
MAARPNLAVFLHSGEYDRMHQALSIVAAAAAEGRRSELFFFWWALARIAENNLDEPDFGNSETQKAAANRFEQHGAPTLRTLLEHIKQSGLCTIHACTGSMTFIGAKPSGIEHYIDRFSGWNTILRLTEGIVDRFYL